MIGANKTKTQFRYPLKVSLIPAGDVAHSVSQLQVLSSAHNLPLEGWGLVLDQSQVRSHVT